MFKQGSDGVDTSLGELDEDRVTQRIAVAVEYEVIEKKMLAENAVN